MVELAEAIVEAAVNVEQKVLTQPTMGSVILRLGALPKPWESGNIPEDLPFLRGRFSTVQPR